MGAYLPGPMRAIVRFFVAASALGASACASTPPRASAATTEAPPPPAPVDAATLQDRKWGVVRSPTLGLKLALPEASGWLAPRTPGPSGAGWELRHEPTSTTLSVHRWRASRLPSPDACEADLRARTADLIAPDENNLVGRREVRVPRGFVTRITLVATPGKHTRVSGQAIAIGAGVGECLSLVARTECESEVELAERLRLLDAALAHVRLTEIEDRVPDPEPISR